MSYPPTGPPPGGGGYPPTGPPPNYGQAPPPYYDDYDDQQQHQQYVDGASSSRGSGGGLGQEVKNVGNFLKHNKMAAATTAFNYKCGGTLGKMFAAGQAYDLASRYQDDRKYQKATASHSGYDLRPEEGGGYYEPQQSYGQPQHGGYGPPGGGGAAYYAPQPSRSPQPPHKSKNVLNNVLSSKTAGDLLHGGQMALGKTQKFVSSQLGVDAMKHFTSGTNIQLASAVTGRTLQIMSCVADGGRLFLDANGAQGPQAWNATFTVIRTGEKEVMLHNNNNYIMIFGGQATVCPCPIGQTPPPSCRLRVHKCQKGVSLESITEPNNTIAALPDGKLKQTFGVDCRAWDASFNVINL